MYLCLLACLQPYTINSINLKWAHSNILFHELCDGQWRATARVQRRWPGAKTTEVKAHRATTSGLCFYRRDRLTSMRLHCKLHVCPPPYVLRLTLLLNLNIPKFWTGMHSECLQHTKRTSKCNTSVMIYHRGASLSEQHTDLLICHRTKQVCHAQVDSYLGIT